MTTEFDAWRAGKRPVDREKLTAGIDHDLVALPDEDLDLVRTIVADLLAHARRKGTACRIDGPGLAEAQRQGEAPTGVAAILGRWPGEESDEQVAEALEELS